MAKVTSLSSLGWAHYTLYEALPRMIDRGFQRVEFASFHSYCFHFNFGSPTPPELKQLLADAGLKPVALNWSPGAPYAFDEEDTARFIRDFERKIPQAAEVGIPMMSMHYGERNDRGDQRQQLERAAQVYDQIARFAEPYGIRMLLEVPHLYMITWTTETVLRLFGMLKSPNIGALVDCSHWGISGYDLDDFLSALGDRLWHVHLRDSAGADTADRGQQLEMTPGKGAVDFKTFGEALDRANYQGDVSIEFEYRDMTFEAIEHEYDEGLKYLANVGWEFPDSVKY
ncbi:MAG: sugar phosphate isomerase/epimerase [Planctomycetota bacterium]|nr:sugar phosphate isomerase/epimerase [Planctomycetota bacterium]